MLPPSFPNIYFSIYAGRPSQISYITTINHWNQQINSGTFIYCLSLELGQVLPFVWMSFVTKGSSSESCLAFSWYISLVSFNLQQFLIFPWFWWLDILDFRPVVLLTVPQCSLSDLSLWLHLDYIFWQAYHRNGVFLHSIRWHRILNSPISNNVTFNLLLRWASQASPL